MRKTEFMDLLKYYFRKSDKGDLKGILEDCEEQFRLGSKEGKSEEEICCKLGHPKNIYRYYIGQPVIPEDNPRMPGAGYGNFEDFGPGQTQQNNLPYDWDKSPERQQRHAESESYYRQPPACDNYGRAPYDDGYGRRPRQQPLHYEEDTKTGQDFDWGNDDSVSNASKAVARTIFRHSRYTVQYLEQFSLFSFDACSHRCYWDFLYSAQSVHRFIAVANDFYDNANFRSPGSIIRSHDSDVCQSGLSCFCPQCSCTNDKEGCLMTKVVICLVLTCVFSFLSLNSFMSNDYVPLKQWMTYYTEYKALTNALSKGNESKEEILAKLKRMYPEKADQIEAQFKAKYGTLKDSAKDAESSVESRFSDSATSNQRSTTNRSTDTVRQDTGRSASTERKNTTDSNRSNDRNTSKATTNTTQR
jgi:uncharacterized membrane protein